MKLSSRLSRWVRNTVWMSRNSSSNTQPTWPRLGSEPNSEEPTDVEQIRQAQRAEELLRDPLLADSLLAIDSDLIQQMREAKLDNPEVHTRLITALQISAAMRKHLWRLLQEGHAAQQRIEMRGRRID